MTISELNLAGRPFCAMREVCIGCAGSKVESPRFRPVKAGSVGGLWVTIPTQNNVTLQAKKKVFIHVYPRSLGIYSVAYHIGKLW